MLTISKLTDYAIIVMAFIANHNLKLLSVAEIAAGSGVPAPTVSKVLKMLATAGVVKATRGAAGGYSLARATTCISVLQIVEAVDGKVNISRSKRADMRPNWLRINSAVKQSLAEVSLADLSSPSPTCPTTKALYE